MNFVFGWGFGERQRGCHQLQIIGVKRSGRLNVCKDVALRNQKEAPTFPPGLSSKDKRTKEGKRMNY